MEFQFFDEVMNIVYLDGWGVIVFNCVFVDEYITF